MTAVLAFARTSTGEEGGQDSAKQVADIRALCAARGWSLDDVDVHVADGVHGDEEDPPQRKELLKKAASGRYQRIVVSSLDRWTREGPAPLLWHAYQVGKVGCRFFSIKEPSADSDDIGDVVLFMAAWSARQQLQRTREYSRRERERMRNELKANGRVFSKKKGKVITAWGRPARPLPKNALGFAAVLRGAGLSWREITERVNGRLEEWARDVATDHVCTLDVARRYIGRGWDRSVVLRQVRAYLGEVS